MIFFKLLLILSFVFSFDQSYCAQARPDAEKKEGTEFYKKMGRRTQEAGITEHILSFLKPKSGKKDWTIVYEIPMRNPDLKLAKALILNDGTLILAYTNGIIEIRQKNKKTKIINNFRDKQIKHLNELGADKFEVGVKRGNQIEDRDYIDDYIVSKTENQDWNIVRSHNIKVGINALPELVVTEINGHTLILNDKPEVGKVTTAFVQDGQSVKIYALKSQVEVLENMF